MKNFNESWNRAIQARIDSWRCQHAALDAAAYQLSFIAQRSELTTFVYGKGRGESNSDQVYTATEIEVLIPFAVAKNVEKYEVYITPIDSAYHYLVIDCMNEASYGQLIDAGYTPCLVLKSSSRNWQAILKSPRITDTSDEQNAASRVLQRINEAVGDPNLSSAIQAFPMNGFVIQKLGKFGPSVRIIEATGGICERTAERLDMARQGIKKRQAEQLIENTAQAPRETAQESDSQNSLSAADEYRRLTQHLPSSSNWSAMDFGTAFGMIVAGWPRPSVEQALVDASPGIAERHPDVLDYVRRTLDAVERAAH